VAVTAHSEGLLLSILRVCYCPFCGSITTHSEGLLLPILRVCYCPCCECYFPSCGSVTVNPAGLLLPILFGHVVLIPVTLVPRVTRTSINGLPLVLNIHNTSACAPELVKSAAEWHSQTVTLLRTVCGFLHTMHIQRFTGKAVRLHGGQQECGN